MSGTDNLAGLEDPILLGDEARRRHAEELARIAADRDAADRDVALERERRVGREERRPYLIGAVICVALLVAVCAVTWALTWSAQRSREAHSRDEERRAQLVRDCVQAGDQWIGDDCVIVVRPGGGQ